MRWRGWRPEGRPPRGSLASEAEAFLRGELAERLEERGAPTPVWAWTNVLAHGTEDALRRATAQQWPGAVANATWHRVRAFLATEVLAVARRRGPLATLQRTVLVPLELDLAARPGVRRWGPRQLAGAVEVALAGYGRDRRRATPSGTS